jgi:hypothetical protein
MSYYLQIDNFIAGTMCLRGRPLLTVGTATPLPFHRPPTSDPPEVGRPAMSVHKPSTEQIFEQLRSSFITLVKAASVRPSFRPLSRRASSALLSFSRLPRARTLHFSL